MKIEQRSLWGGAFIGFFVSMLCVGVLGIPWPFLVLGWIPTGVMFLRKTEL